jgi:hypothetical protein
MRLEEGPDRTVQRHGVRIRHGAQRRLEDQVVRKRAVAQNLRGFELTPTIGDVQRVLAQDRGGEFGAEILAGERRNLGQLAGCRRQLCQTPCDQFADVRRRRQCRIVGRSTAQYCTQRLEDEHRIPAGMTEQRFDPGGWIEGG